MENIVIRQATEQDAELIADMSRKTFYETFYADNKPEDMEHFMTKQFTKEALMKEVGAPGNIFLLAYDGKDAVGYARLREQSDPALNNGNAIEVARIYADTTAIGKGVGKALMNESIRIAVSMRKDVIWLGVWEKNERAISFYKKFGFEKFGEHDFWLGNDCQRDWLMKKELANK